MMMTHAIGRLSMRRTLHQAYAIDEEGSCGEGRLRCFECVPLGVGGGRRRRVEGDAGGGGEDFSEMATPFMT